MSQLFDQVLETEVKVLCAQSSGPRVAPAQEKAEANVIKMN